MIEIYNVGKFYLEGWYTLADLKRIAETAERINKTNEMLAAQAKPDGFKTMDETSAPIVEVGWQTNRKGPQ